MPPHTVDHPYIRIVGNSEYSRQGDIVSLYVDRIDNQNEQGITSGDLALQLWACQAPFFGGPLAGWKIAEHLLGTLQPNHSMAPVKSDVPADLPEYGDYAIAMVVSEWDGEGYNRIHDVHNYPNRDLFLHPRLKGAVGYHSVDARRLFVEIEQVENPRDPVNLSGTLTLELWALPEPYAGGAFAGHALAAVTLGSLPGGESWQYCSYVLEMNPPPPGSYALVLMLREWVGNGYHTRDFTNLTEEVTLPIVIAAPGTSEAVNDDVSQDRETSLEKTTEPATGTAVADVAARTAHEAESDVKKGIEEVSAPRKSQHAFVQVMLVNLKRFLHRMFS
jgi:hypothetical protein